MSGWTPASSYWYGSPPLPSQRVSTSRTEIVHVAIAFTVLTVDFIFLFPGLGGALTGRVLGTSYLANAILFGAFAALTGFVAHELAHKVAAQRLGYWAEFRMSPVGLVFSLFTAYAAHFLLAAPGATVIGGMDDRRAWGRTSLAGPGLNLVEAAILLSIGWGVGFEGFGGLGALLGIVAFINAYFAAFNLLPLGPLDGRKIWSWNRGVWVLSFVVSAAFALLLYLAIYLRLRPF